MPPFTVTWSSAQKLFPVTSKPPCKVVFENPPLEQTFWVAAEAAGTPRSSHMTTRALASARSFWRMGGLLPGQPAETHPILWDAPLSSVAQGGRPNLPSTSDSSRPVRDLVENVW